MAEYRLVGRLETGELAELYRASRDGSAPVVVKLFHSRTSDAAYARDVADTARLLGGVTHPLVVPVLEIGLVRQRLAIVRQDVGKVTLGQALNRLNTREVVLPPMVALGLVLELLDALQEGHAAGVVHGALTPGNVVLTAEGRPAICDFGALRALEASPVLKRSFGARGRSSYRAPEVAKGEDPSVESDVYSVGAIAYELLTLKEVVQAEGVKVSTRRTTLPPPSRVDRRVNARLDPILLRALDLNPGRRYHSAREFAQALRDFVAVNGGLPAREEQRRFVATIFPNEVNLDHLGPVPFGEPFRLKEVAGADLEALEDRSVVLTPRDPFSGGEVDAMAETETGLPVLDDPGGPVPATEGTQPDGQPLGDGAPPAASWDAPPAAVAVTRRAGLSSPGAQKALERRVRVIEDFQAVAPQTTDTLEEPLPVLMPRHPPRPEPAPPPPAPATVETPAMGPTDSQPLSGPVVIEPGGKRRRLLSGELRLLQLAKKRRGLLVVAALIASLGAAALAWVALRTRVPDFVPPRKGTKPARQVARANPPTDAPSVPHPEPLPPLRPVPRPAPPEPPEPCYAPPAGRKTGTLAVSARGPVVVRVDGQKVCGAVGRIPVEVGRRRVRITDSRTGEEFEAAQRIEARKTAKLVPVFRRR